MKKLAIIFFALALFMSPGLFAQMPTWNLSKDLQMSFTQRSDGVWYFMESDSYVHDPALYKLLPKYFASCGFAGVGCWGGIEDLITVCSPVPCVVKTKIAFNFTNKAVGSWCSWEVCGIEIPGFLPHTARVLPNPLRLAVVAWQSPVTGKVWVKARFAARNGPVAMSMGWSVEKGAQTLRSDRIGVGHEDRALADLPNVQVSKNDVLYFIVDPSWWGFQGRDYWVDLQVTITQVQ